MQRKVAEFGYNGNDNKREKARLTSKLNLSPKQPASLSANFFIKKTRAVRGQVNLDVKRAE